MLKKGEEKTRKKVAPQNMFLLRSTAAGRTFSHYLNYNCSCNYSADVQEGSKPEQVVSYGFWIHS